MFFDQLQKEQKIEVLHKVGNIYDKYYNQATEYIHDIFAKRYPYEYSNTPIGDLQGEAKTLHDSLFQHRLNRISPFYQKTIENEAKKEYVKKYVSTNKQREKLQGWIKKWK